METRHTIIDSELGPLTLVASGDALAGLYFDHHRHPPAGDVLGERVSPPGDPLLEQAATELHEYLAGDCTAFDVPVALRGNSFQLRVWELLETIPFGQTTTYGALAGHLGDRALARAVGRAVGQNPVSVIVPCHRVIASDGALTGYASGLERKRFLLSLEAPQVPVAATLW